MNFIKLDGNLVIGSGRCHPDFVPDGCVAVEQLPDNHDCKIYWHNGGYVYSSDPHYVPGYGQRRLMSYPSTGDQLDAIWKAIAPLIEHPEAEAVLAKIQAVKDANPKP